MADFPFRNLLADPVPAKPPADPNASPTWEDYGRTVAGGAMDIAGQAGAGVRMAGEAIGSDGLASVGRAVQQGAHNVGDDLTAGVSPVARQRGEASVLSSEFWKNPGSATALKLTRMAPTMVVASIGPALLGRAAGALAANTVSAGTGAAMGAGQLADEVYKIVDNTSDADLKKQSQLYAGIRARSPDEETARAEFASRLRNDDYRMLFAVLGNAAGNTAGVGGQVGRLAAKEGASTLVGAAERSALKSAGIGALEAGGGGAVGAGSSDYAGQDAAVAAGAQKEVDRHRWLSAVAEGFGGGVITGGPLGALGAHGEPKKPKTAVDVDPAVTPEVPAAEATPAPAEEAAAPTKAPRKSRAKKAQVEATTAVGPDASQAAALTAKAGEAKPEQATPEVTPPAPPEAAPTDPAAGVPKPEPEAVPLNPADQKAVDDFNTLLEHGEEPPPADTAAPVTPEAPPERVLTPEDQKAVEDFNTLLEQGDTAESSPAAEAARAEPARAAPDEAIQPARPSDDVAEANAAFAIPDETPKATAAVEKAKARGKGKKAKEPVESWEEKLKAMPERKVVDETGRRRWEENDAHLTDTTLHPVAKEKEELRRWLNGLTDEQHAELRKRAIWDPNMVPVDSMEPVRVLAEYKRALAMGDSYTHDGMAHDPSQAKPLTPEVKPELPNVQVIPAPAPTAENVTQKLTALMRDRDIKLKQQGMTVEESLKVTEVAGRKIQALMKDLDGKARVQAMDAARKALKAEAAEAKVVESKQPNATIEKIRAEKEAETAAHDKSTAKGEKGKVLDVQVTYDKNEQAAFLKRAAAFVKANPDGDTLYHEAVKAGKARQALGRGAPGPKARAHTETIQRAMRMEAREGAPVAKVRGAVVASKTPDVPAAPVRRASAEEVKAAAIAAAVKTQKEAALEAKIRKQYPGFDKWPADIQQAAREQFVDAKADTTGSGRMGGKGLGEAGDADGATSLSGNLKSHGLDEDHARAREEGGDVLDVIDRERNAEVVDLSEDHAATADKDDIKEPVKGDPTVDEYTKDPPPKPKDGRELGYKEPETVAPTERAKPQLAEGEGYTIAVAKKAPVVEVAKRRVFKRANDGTIYDVDTKETATPVRSGTVRTALGKFDLSGMPGVSQHLLPFFQKRLLEKVGDVPVHVLSDADFTRLHGDHAEGIWQDSGSHEIHVRQSSMEGGPAQAHLVMHEAAHAAMAHAIENDAVLKAQIKSMHDEVATHLVTTGRGDLLAENGMRDVHEFMSEAFSNPKFQALLAEVRVSDKLAGELGLPKTGVWNAWSVMVQTVRRFLKLPGREGYSMAEAVLRTGERAMNGDHTRPDSYRGRALNTRQVTSWVKEDRPIIAGLKRVGRYVQRSTDDLTMLGQRAATFGNEKFAQAGRTLAELVNRRDAERSKLLERAGGVIETTRKTADLIKDHGEAKFAEAADVLFDAQEMRVDPRPGATNEHLGTGAKSDRTDAWQAKGRLADLQRRFNRLPPELQDHIAEISKVLKEERDFQVREMIDKMLDTAQIPPTPGLADRIFNGKVSDTDKTLFATHKVLDHLQRIARQYKHDGFYAPQMRHGDFVVNGYHEIKAPAGATQVAHNKVRFVGTVGKGETAPRKQAKAFAQGHDLTHIDTEHVYVDANDHSKIVDATDVDAVHAFDVTLQNQHTEFHANEADALKARQALEDRGLKGLKDGVLTDAPYMDLRKDLEANGFRGLMPAQFESMVTSLNGDKRFERMSAAQKAVMIQTLHEVGTRLLPGNRIQKHALERQNVGGYSRDILRSMSQYGQMSAGFRANVMYSRRISDAIKAMDAEIGATTAKDNVRVRMREIQEEMAKRAVQGVTDNGGDGLMARFSRGLNRVSMADKLVGFSFHMINAQEPWTTSLPVIGGRHGMLQAGNALRQAYSMIGARGALGAGLRDTFHAFKNDHGFTDFQKTFKEEIFKNVGGDEARRLGELVDHLHDTNIMGHEAGMEVARSANPSTNQLVRGFERMELMARQVGATIEAVNRAVTALAAYRVEYKKNGGNHEAAMQYAHDVTHNTMGNYSGANSAPMFNSNLGRVALQFKKFAVKTYYLLGKTMAGTLRGDKEAAKQFAGLMVTHAMVAGALGLPWEPVKVALLASNALGISGFTFDDFEQAVRKTSAEIMGKTGGELFSRGLTRGIGFDTSSRQGLDNLATGFSPKDTKADSLKAYAFDVFGGAGAGYVIQLIQGAQELFAGNPVKAGEKLVPLKAFRDASKAVTGYAQGTKDRNGRETAAPLSAGEAIGQALGFRPARIAEGFEQQKAFRGDQKAATESRTKAMNLALQDGSTAAGWKRLQEWNKTQPATNKLAYEDLVKAQKRRATEQATGSNVRGMRVTKRDKDAFKQSESIYNAH